MFYYSLLAAGLVLVLCLSIGCNICINRKCKSVTLNIQDNGINRVINSASRTHHISQDESGIEFFEQRENDYSHYEAIDESQMLRYPIAGSSANFDDKLKDTNEKKSGHMKENLLSQDEVPYLEVIPDNDDVEAQSDSANISNILKNIEKTDIKDTSSSECISLVDINITLVEKKFRI